MRIAAVAVTATRPADQETRSPRMVRLFALNRIPMRKILIPPYQVFSFVTYNYSSNNYYV